MSLSSRSNLSLNTSKYNIMLQSTARLSSDITLSNFFFHSLELKGEIRKPRTPKDTRTNGGVTHKCVWLPLQGACTGQGGHGPAHSSCPEGLGFLHMEAIFSMFPWAAKLGLVQWQKRGRLWILGGTMWKDLCKF